MQDEIPMRRAEGSPLFPRPHAAWLWLAAYFLFKTGADFLQLPLASPRWMILLAYGISTAAYMLLALAMLAALASFLKTPKRALASVVLGLGAWGFFAWVLQRRLPLPGMVVAFNLLDLGRALAAAGVGALVAAMIRDRNILLPASVFMAFADFVVVYNPIGPVHQALQTHHGRQMIRAMSSHVPTPHPSLAPLTVGMADYVFLAFFFACVMRFEMNLRGTFVAFFVTLTLTLFFVASVNAIPALAPMALAFVAVNFRFFRLSRSEIQAMGVAFALILVVVGVLFVMSRL
jgi:hypothetical protein